MGVSVSAATVVIMIAIISSALVLSTTIHSNLERVNDAYEQRTDRWETRAGTDLRITANTYDPATGTVTVTATNTGRTVLEITAIELIIDGRYATLAITNVRVDGQNRTAWYPQSELEVTASWPTALPSRVMLVTQDGVGTIDSSVSTRAPQLASTTH